MPFEPFERYSPHGSPADVAAFLREYVDAGCTVFNVIPCAEDHETAVTAVGELQGLLTVGLREQAGAGADGRRAHALSGRIG